jgi:hypothetical protein
MSELFSMCGADIICIIHDARSIVSAPFSSCERCVCYLCSRTSVIGATYPAIAHPTSVAIRYIHRYEIDHPFIQSTRIEPVETAELNAPPEILPTATAPTKTVRPIARPR